MIECPKCRYRRRPADSHVHGGVCPACGIAYAKYHPPESEPAAGDYTPESESPGFGRRFINTLMYVPERTDTTVFAGRLALYGVFVIWGASFILAGVDWNRIGGSFMHSVNLPFHEFGHVLFGILGRFMGILGGSLFQVLFPLVFVFAFSFQMRDNFAASICLWWCGQSFIDVSPYIADAPHRDLPLILGMSEDFHDWGNLLTMTDALHMAEPLANLSFITGSLLILLSFVWGGRLLWLQYSKPKQGF